METTELMIPEVNAVLTSVVETGTKTDTDRTGLSTIKNFTGTALPNPGGAMTSTPVRAEAGQPQFLDVSEVSGDKPWVTLSPCQHIRVGK